MENSNVICMFTELKKLQVIDLISGKNLGFITDAEFDLFLGKINAITVPKKRCVFSFFKRSAENYIRIPYFDIEKIGDDTILVRIKE